MIPNQIDHATQHYLDNPRAEEEALARLGQITRAIRSGIFEDPAVQLPAAARHVARSEFSSTYNYSELLEVQADLSGNADWQQLAEDALNLTAQRQLDYANTISDQSIPHEDAVERLHRLCRDDFNTRVTLVLACPAIYTETRLHR